jgi:hypothetical protein
MTDRDRLAEIKARYGYDPSLSDQHDVFWLIDEVEAAWERETAQRNSGCHEHSWRQTGGDFGQSFFECSRCGREKRMPQGVAP